jgi:hypothetical protein
MGTGVWTLMANITFFVNAKPRFDMQLRSQPFQGRSALSLTELLLDGDELRSATSGSFVFGKA